MLVSASLLTRHAKTPGIFLQPVLAKSANPLFRTVCYKSSLTDFGVPEEPRRNDF